jgi:hypothetical protein
MLSGTDAISGKLSQARGQRRVGQKTGPDTLTDLLILVGVMEQDVVIVDTLATVRK